MDHEPNAQYPYIEMLRLNPLIVFCIFLGLLPLEESKKRYLELVKKEPDLKNELTPIKLFSLIGRLLCHESFDCGLDEINSAVLGFIVYPELLKTSGFDLLLKLTDDERMFRGVYSYLQKTHSTRPEALNNSKLLAEGQCRTQQNLNTINLLSLSQEKQLIMELIKNLTLDPEQESDPEQSAKILHFLMNKGVSLPEGTSSEKAWYVIFPWEDFRDYLIFLFEPIRKQKEEILTFWKQSYPNLVLHHLMKGHFFIAEQMVELGLEIPKITLTEFFEQSVRLGLSNSKEIKRYHAVLLLMQEKGMLDTNLVKKLLSTLIDPKRITEIQKLALDNLSALSKYYFENIDENLEINKDTIKRISDLMLNFERDYALALSSLYNRLIVHSTNTFAFREINLPESPMNSKLANSYFLYGYRASSYSFLEHGYNTTVYAGLEECPSMAWESWSNATQITA